MSSTKKLLILTTSDGQDFELEEELAIQAQTITNMVLDGCTDGAIPFPFARGIILAKVIEYWKKCSNVTTKGSDIENELLELDKEFADGVEEDQEMLFSLIMAANYLDTQPLLDALSKKVANMMQGKSPEELRKKFHIKTDYTLEEEKQVLKENSWAFSDEK